MPLLKINKQKDNAFYRSREQSYIILYSHFVKVMQRLLFLFKKLFHIFCIVSTQLIFGGQAEKEELKWHMCDNSRIKAHFTVKSPLPFLCFCFSSSLLSFVFVCHLCDMSFPTLWSVCVFSFPFSFTIFSDWSNKPRWHRFRKWTLV